MDNIEKFKATHNLTNKKNRKIEYIVVHYTAGITSKAGTALSTAKYFNKESTKASADFIVDDETVVQFNNDFLNKYSWHCGGAKQNTKGGSLHKICTNANSIGIEMCSTNYNNKVEKPNDKSWDITVGVLSNTVQLICELMESLNIPFKNIIRHYDVTGKLCPGIVGWNADSGSEEEWIIFKEAIQDKINNKESIEELTKEVHKLTEQNKELKNKNQALEKRNSELVKILMDIKAKTEEYFS